MQTKYFEYVREIAQCGSITKAAENLYISQQALSEALKLLEQELDFKIFSRSNKGVVLTSSGEKFLRDLEIIMPLMLEWKQLAEHREKKVKVKIYLQYILSDIITNDKLLNELKHMSEYQVEWQALSARNLVKEIERKNDGIGIMMPSKDSKLYHTLMDLVATGRYKIDVIASSRMCVLLAKNDVLAKKDFLQLRDLRGHSLLVNHAAAGVDTMQKIIKVTGKDATVLPEAANLVTYLAKNDDLFAYLPQSVIENNVYVQNGEVVLRYLDIDMDLYVDYYMLYATEYYQKNSMLLEQIKSCFAVL